VRFISEHKSQFGVEPVCRVLSEHGLKIAPSSYYDAARRGHRPGQREMSGSRRRPTPEQLGYRLPVPMDDGEVLGPGERDSGAPHPPRSTDQRLSSGLWSGWRRTRDGERYGLDGR
jgi:hypothetical protein